VKGIVAQTRNASTQESEEDLEFTARLGYNSKTISKKEKKNLTLEPARLPIQVQILTITS
jgi:hypothetical protein